MLIANMDLTREVPLIDPDDQSEEEVPLESEEEVEVPYVEEAEEEVKVADLQVGKKHTFSR